MDQTEISGSVERITFYNAENGYTVLRLKPDSRGMLPFKYPARGQELITVVGNLPELQPGEWVKLTGQWINNPKHGRQFKPERCEQALPATTDGIKRYLGSGMIRGVGKGMAERIVAYFGDDTLHIIDHEPARLREVLGVGAKRAAQIEAAWEEQRAIKDVMIFLQSHGVSTSLAVKIYKEYGDDAVATVQQKPYQLVSDIRGIGFKTADKIAQALGLERDDPQRIEAGIAYTLNKMAGDGHVYVPQDELEPQSADILGVREDQVTYVIDQLENDALIKIDELAEAAALGEARAVYLTPLYYSEIGVTERIRGLLNQRTSRVRVAYRRESDLSRLLQQIEQQAGIQLASQQRQAVLTAVREKVSVLTGGPGTGKTTTLRSLLDLLDRLGRSYSLASPTGRAAKRLTEATGRPAKTIHRLLEFQPGTGFGRNGDYPLDSDIIIIDEASMLDLVLANNLLKAVEPTSHLLLVGDIDQLPSVGAGDVLGDLIDSGIVPVVRLQTIFRQAQDSLIITNAHRINRGDYPLTQPEANDFFIFIKDNIDELPHLIADLIERRIPAKFGLDPFNAVQVLAPMYNGMAGVSNLNLVLQNRLNPAGRVAEKRLGGRLFRVGDKMMQTVNNYDKNVFNGDIGRITAIDPVQQLITLTVDGAPVVYDFLESDELVHAYAISVHKSQGSEYPCVVIPVVTQHYLMLQRNLLYTAITRAKRVVILVGTRRAIAMAIKNNKTSERHTALDRRLRR